MQIGHAPAVSALPATPSQIPGSVRHMLNLDLKLHRAEHLTMEMTMLNLWTPLFWTKAHALCEWPPQVVHSGLGLLVEPLVPRHWTPCHRHQAVRLWALTRVMHNRMMQMPDQTCVPQCSLICSQRCRIATSDIIHLARFRNRRICGMQASMPMLRPVPI